MKRKLLFSLFALFSFAFTHAQSLSVIYDGQLLTNGQEVEILGELNEDMFYEVVAHARIKNNTDRDVSVLVHRITHDTVTGSLNQFCWVQCFAPWVDVSPTAFIIPANDTTPEETFSGHYLPQNKLGTTVLEYVFYIETEPTDSVSFVAKFKITPAGINDWKDKVRFGNAYPNPASSMVYFDLDIPAESKKASIRIHNLLGQPLVEKEVNTGSNHVSIPVAELKEGIYFYTLFVNDKSIMTKKLVIKR